MSRFIVYEMRDNLLLILTSLIFTTALSTQGPKFKCELNYKHSTEGVYTVYDITNGIMHVASFVGDPTFMIYRTNKSDSLKIHCNESKQITNVAISSYELLYGFVIRNLIEFKVQGSGVNFNRQKFDNNTVNLFNTTSLSNLKYNITSLGKNCDETGKITVSLQQKNISSNYTQMNILFNFQAYSSEGRLMNQPRYAYRGNNSVIGIVIKDYQYHLTNTSNPASRLALELDFIRNDKSQLFYSSVSNIDDEYTPAVFLQNTLSLRQGGYYYWKPIAYVAQDRTVETSMMATYLNGTYTNSTVKLNTTGFYHYLQGNINASLERAFMLFGTDGDSTLNADYVYFRMELGLGTPPTDSISLPLIIAIGVGFGLPVLGLLLGVVGMCFFMAYKCCFRKSTRNARYVMIN
ncbi:Lysosomal protein NCU-G1-A-like [Oopsacas minuta]|uniref:Lysosomal protein NCU-G1-A-like n=1 Tax=Oopsacas minuta TaxID=111878 RepID=A0AAV7KFG9_9METZ|nr:Lysosomal protein NCU-G1-A-like [Oopsacas minuta]